jgi:hypothetical protein
VAGFGMPETNPFLKFLATTEPAELGPGPRKGVQPKHVLERELEAAFQQSKTPGERQQLIRALVLLWHDYLEPAHVIAQDIDDSDGAFVHGIMHRREPDYANAAYWFRRVGTHPAFQVIAQRVADLLEAKGQGDLQARLGRGGSWDPFAFIEACETIGSSNDNEQVQVLQQIQRIETEALLNHFA